MMQEKGAIGFYGESYGTLKNESAQVFYRQDKNHLTLAQLGITEKDVLVVFCGPCPHP